MYAPPSTSWRFSSACRIEDTGLEEARATHDAHKIGLTHDGRNRVAHGLLSHSVDKPEAF